MIRWLLAILIFCGSARASISYTEYMLTPGTSANYVSIGGGGVVGTDTNYARYTMVGGRKIATATGYAITINTNWVVLNLGIDTVAFGTGNGASARGVYVSANMHDIIIDGGYFLHMPTGALADDNANPTWSGSEPVMNATAIRLNGYNLELKNIKKAIVKGYVTISGGDNVAGVITGGSYNVNIHDNDSLINSIYGYEDRQYFLGSVYRATAGISSLSGGAQYNVRFAHNVCIGKAHTMVFLYGNSSTDPIKAYVDSNDMLIDIRNNRYPEHVSTDGNGYYGCANAYCVQFTRAAIGSRILGNQMRAGSTYLGGQGIHMVNTRGTDFKQVEIAYNYIDMHQGFETGFQTGFHPVGVKFRQHCAGLWEHHDTVIYTGDTIMSVNVHGKAWAAKGHAIQLQQWDPGVPLLVTIENNIFKTVARSDVNTSLYLVDAVNFEDFNSTPLPEVVWQYNRIDAGVSDCYAWGQGGDGGAGHLTIFGDTISLTPMAFSSHQYTFKMGCIDCADIGTGNIVRDVYFGTGTSPTSIVYEWNGVPTAGTEDLTVQKTHRVVVQGTDGRPVSDAIVTATDTYDNLQWSDQSRNNGAASGVTPLLFLSRTATDLDYTPYRIQATKDGLTASITTYPEWFDQTDTIELPVPGTGQWPNKPDTVFHTTTIAVGGASGDANSPFQLYGPKRQIMPTSTGVVCYKTNYSTNYAHLTAFLDGQGTDSTSISATNKAYYEAALATAVELGHRDTALWVCNNKTAYPNVIKVFRVNLAASPPEIIDTINITTTNFSGISVPCYLGGRSFAIEARFSSGTNDNQVLFTVSNDMGATWTTPVQFTNWSGTNIRAGIESWGSGKAWFTGIVHNAGAYPVMRSLLWDGTSWSSNDAPNLQTPNLILAHREYAFIMGDDSTQFIALPDTSATSCMILLSKKTTESTWSYDTMYNAGERVASNCFQGHLGGAFSKSAIDGTIHFGYTKVETPGNPSDQILVERKLDHGIWSDELRVSTDDTVWELAQPNVIPANRGDVAYFQYSQRVNGVWQVELAEILGSGQGTNEVTPVDTTFIVRDTSTIEGGYLTFIGTLSVVLEEDFHFSWQLVDSTTGSNDLIHGVGTGSIPAGQLADTLEFRTNQDATYESDEYVKLITKNFSITSVRNAASDTIAVGTIVNDDAPPTVSRGKKVFGIKR